MFHGSSMSDRKSIPETLLSYDPITGIFLWNSSRGRVKKGDIAGCIKKDGYVYIGLKKKRLLAHRLAFKIMLGYFPEQVDHENHIKSDNRWKNLRAVNNQENQKNRSKSKNNTSGVTGVVWRKKVKRWVARIKVDKKEIHLGYFNKFHEAVNARKLAEVEYKFHKNHGKDK